MWCGRRRELGHLPRIKSRFRFRRLRHFVSATLLPRAAHANCLVVIAVQGVGIFLGFLKNWLASVPGFIATGSKSQGMFVPIIVPKVGGVITCAALVVSATPLPKF